MKTIPNPGELRQPQQDPALENLQRLTLKQQAVLSEIMSDPDSLNNPKGLCERAGYTVAGKSHANQIIGNIQERIGTVFADRFDVTYEKLFNTLMAGLDAERTVCSTVKHYKNGKLRKAEPKVIILGPDHKTRFAAVMALAKLTGIELQPPKQDAKKDNNSGMTPEAVEKLNARRSAQSGFTVPTTGQPN